MPTGVKSPARSRRLRLRRRSSCSLVGASACWRKVTFHHMWIIFSASHPSCGYFARRWRSAARRLRNEEISIMNTISQNTMPATTLARILVVDDEAPQMKALCETLKDHRYEAVGFTSAKAALEALDKSKFDLLLSDLMMPEM